VIDHTGLNVSHLARSVAFYRAARAPIGYELLVQFPAAVTGGSDVAGFGVAPNPDFWLSAGTANRPALHVAVRASEGAQVDACHAAAMRAGGRDNGCPGLRAHYHPDYYGAFVLDPDNPQHRSGIP
jgi:catechol 2,3-dioxygenase-like lactoylglutathione lyase family enzyme